MQAAITTKVTDAIQSQVDVEALLNQAFAGVIPDRPRLQLLVGPLAGAVNGLIESQVRSFIASDAFREFWIAANTRVQERLVQLLKGETPGRCRCRADRSSSTSPTSSTRSSSSWSTAGSPSSERAELPDQNRQIVLLDSPQLKQVRTIYAFSNPVAKWLIVVVALLFLGGLLLSRRRPRTTVIIGAVLAANALLVALLLSIGRQLFVNQLAGTVFGPASTVFYDTLLSYLERGQRVMFWLGLILVLMGWFAGRTRLGTAARTTTSSGLESVGASLGTPRWQARAAGRSPTRSGCGSWPASWASSSLLWGADLSVPRLFWSFVLVGCSWR